MTPPDAPSAPPPPGGPSPDIQGPVDLECLARGRDAKPAAACKAPQRPGRAGSAASTGFFGRALRHPSFLIGAALSALLVLAALVSLVWAPYPPAEIDIPNKLAPPGAAHWLGTDSLGRDIASQLLVGAQNSIVVGVIAVGIGVDRKSVV